MRGVCIVRAFRLLGVVAVVVVDLLGSDADADAEAEPPMSAKPDAVDGDGASGRKWIDVFFFKMLLGGSD